MPVMANRAWMSTTATGTASSITLGLAQSGYQTFADAGITDGQSVHYTIIDGASWEIGTGVSTEAGTLMSRTVIESSNSDTYISLSGSATVFITALASDIVQPSQTATITVGYTITPYNNGTKSATSDTIFNAANGNYQYITNGASAGFAIGAATADSAIDVLVTNATNAGSVSASSGFTVGSNTGDAYATTSAYKFILSLRRINGVSTYVWKALQVVLLALFSGMALLGDAGNLMA